ncbi:glycosyltransferase [Lachnoclostridium sp. Marseille-P6806]|uniref:glycosyltransferase n=1 Tax=Lachnoclostridium sp. Marseille-P6806 TaxID=2364793 RepID=UPI001F5FE0BB|nr:glycosyltransferase [Lachnoclostridium sp. Marseille-P6806]
MTGDMAGGKPIRILHVLGVLNMGGAESRIMDLYRHIDRSRVQFDFLVHSAAPVPGTASPTTEQLMQRREPEAYDAEARTLGARIYALPRFNGKNLAAYRRAARRFFAEHHDFAAVEGHMTSMASVYLPIAKRAGVPVVIAHVRSAGVSSGLRGLATRLLRVPLPFAADHLLACSRLAGEAVYGRRMMRSGRVRVVPNALEIEEFRFRPAVRKAVRQELGIPENAVVLGHVGRFDDAKNHSYLAERFIELCSGEKGDFRLLLVGEGRRMDAVRERLAAAGLAQRVMFCGQQPRRRTQALYQAMDVFVFPSLYEGLPGTVIEAQAAGLPCLISDRITDETAVTPFVERLSLEEPERWIRELRTLASEQAAGDAAFCAEGTERAAGAGTESVQLCGRPGRSEAAQAALAEAGFDIRRQARSMQEWYLSLK